MISILNFILVVINILLIYLLIDNILYRQFITKRLKKGVIDIKLDKSIETKMLLKSKYIKKKNFPNKLETLLLDASIKMDAKKFLKIIIIASFAVFTFTFIMKRSILFSSIAFLIVPIMIFLILKSRKKKRVEVFASQLPEATEFLSSSLKSGYSFIQALNMIANELVPPASEEFKRIIEDISVGKTYAEAFDSFIERNPIEEAEILSAAILINRETGGNLSKIADTVSHTMREREVLKKEIKSLTAQGRLSGVILVMLPIAIFALLYVINNDYVKPLWTHPLGRIMLVVGMGSSMLGALLIKLIINIDG